MARVKRSKWWLHLENWHYLFCRSESPLTVNVDVYVKAWSRRSCIFAILYFKLNEIELRIFWWKDIIYIAEREIKEN